MVKPSGPKPLDRRAAVFDFQVPPEIYKDQTYVEGFWVGARTVFQNRLVGSHFADVLARELISLDYLEQHSRADLRFYMSRKRQRLTEVFSGLSDDDYDEMLAEVSPLDYGLELGVDELITGKILQSFTTHQRIFHFWRSAVRVRVDIWDVSQGEVVWSRTFGKKKWFYSQLETMERLAPEIATAIDRHYRGRAGDKR